MSILRQVSFGNIEVSFLTNYDIKIEPMPFTTLHSHGHGELQVILEGEIIIDKENWQHRFSKGDAIYIPPKTQHICYDGDTPSKRITIPVFSNHKKFSFCKLSQAFIDEFTREIKSKNSEGVIEYLIYIFANLLKKENFSNTNPQYSQIISSFFESNFHNKNIHLSDLAKLLNFSEAHTQRIVKKCTGKPFLQSLTEFRIKNAETMHSTHNMSYYEIYPYVGYESYAGFYKAKKSLNKSKEEL